MEERYIRSLACLTAEEQALLAGKRAAVIGCGGLGGHIVELLARAGLGAMTVADGDFFAESDLNRQLLSLPSLLGKGKAAAAAERIKAVDPRIAVRCFEKYLDRENAGEILAGADIVLDALDSAAGRILLEEECARRGLWLVHGAVEGWNIQICLVPPGSGILKRLYAGAQDARGGGTISPVPALCAAMQCAEAIKRLCGRTCPLEGRLLTGDGLSMEFCAVDMTERIIP